MLHGVRRTTVALVAITGVASAQPLPDPRIDPRSSALPQSSEPRATSNDPRMPITLRPGEVLGGDASSPIVGGQGIPGQGIPGQGIGGDLFAPPPPPLSLEHPIDPETY